MHLHTYLRKYLPYLVDIYFNTYKRIRIPRYLPRYPHQIPRPLAVVVQRRILALTSMIGVHGASSNKTDRLIDPLVQPRYRLRGARGALGARSQFVLDLKRKE